MKIAAMETLHCDAGWRNYHFLKITTDDGIVGWSEFDEGFGSPGVTAVIERLAPRLIGEDVTSMSASTRELHCCDPPGRRRRGGAGPGRHRERPARRQGQGIGVPCLHVAGRQRCAGDPALLVALRDVANQSTRMVPAGDREPGRRQGDGRGGRDKGFTALKTNIFDYSDGKPQGWRPGFGAPFAAGANVERDMLRDLRAHLEAFRDGAGPMMRHPARPELQLLDRRLREDLREIADLDMFWIEIDTYNPLRSATSAARARIRSLPARP